MNRRFILLLSVCVSVLQPISQAYELETHRLLSTDAADRSVLAQPSFLRSIGIDNPIDTQKYPDSMQQGQSIRNLIGQGAVFEDTLTKTRVRHHFYNPIDDQALSRLGISLGTPSPSWVLEDDGQKNVLLDGEQEFSYRDARGYYREALTNPDHAVRDQQFGAVFESLGHVVHHLQDMAQPAHVRNDLHLNFAGVLTNENVNEWLNQHIGNPSQLELWAERDINLKILARDPALVGYDINSDKFRSTFTTPRKFWKTGAGEGMAEYANHGFISPGSNFTGDPISGVKANSVFQYPDGTGIEIEGLPLNDPTLMGTEADNLGLHGQVQFIKKAVDDRVLGTPSEKIRLSTYSIFTEDFAKATNKYRFSTNRFVYKDITNQLIPRAVAFSAGMINYFFRGEIDFVRDENDPNKFHIVNLSNEQMSGRFALYYDAKDGNRYPVQVDPGDPNIDPNDAKTWRLVVTAKTDPDDGSNKSAAISFIAPPDGDPATSPMVPNEYMLVFSGDMGEEKAANGAVGAVVAKAIKAPYNGTIYVRVQNADGQATLRVDKNGTRYVQAGEFDPLANGPYPSLGEPATLMKQVEFTKDPLFGQSIYRTKAVTVGQFQYPNTFPTSYALDGPSGFRIINPAGISWLATSPDPALGEFIVGFAPSMFPDQSTALSFTRTYTNAGKILTTSGVIPVNRTPSQSFQQYMVSGDGLRFGELREAFLAAFPTPPSDPLYDAKYYDIALTLSEVPKAALSLVYQFSAEYSDTFVPGVIETLYPLGGFEQISTCGYFDSAYYDVRLLGYLHQNCQVGGLLQKQESRYVVGYLNGEKAALKTIRTESAFQDFWRHETQPLNSVCYFSEGRISSHSEWNTTTYFTDGKLEAAFNYTPRGANYSYITNSGCSQEFTDAPNIDPGTNSGKGLLRAVTNKVTDALFNKNTGGYGSAPSGLYFRGMELQPGGFVVDASPAGEVFFAKSDMSIIIQESKFGLPKIQLPSDVIKIIAVIWL